MRRNYVLALLTAALLCLTGCFEVEQEFTLNPDGSGKVVHQVKQPDVMGQGEAGLKNVLESHMNSEGVDSWSDVSVEITDDGSFLFTGTAYFSDLNELELENGLEFSWLPAEEGGYRLELQMAESTPTEEVATEQEIEESVKKAKTEWKQMKPMMQGFMSSFQWKSTFHLPGRVVRNSSFEMTGPSTVEFAMSGDRYFEVIEAMMTDEEFLEKQAREGKLGGMDDDEIPPELMERLFGAAGAYAVTTSSVDSQFDYQAAVAEAEAGFGEMMASLAVEPPKEIVPPAAGGDFESVGVISTAYVTDGERAWSQEGATLSIAGKLPGAVITAEEGVLKTAVADDGTDLLPAEEWDRELRVSLDSEDPTMVTFDVVTQLPPQGAEGFREVSGVIFYKSSSGPDEEVELFSGIEPNSESATYGARIMEIEPGFSDGTENLTIEIGLPREEIAEVVFIDPSGSTLEVSNTSTSWGGDSTTRTYTIEGTFPEDGKVAVKVRKDLKTYEIPFEITNIDLTGRPM